MSSPQSERWVRAGAQLPSPFIQFWSPASGTVPPTHRENCHTFIKLHFRYSDACPLDDSRSCQAYILHHPRKWALAEGQGSMVGMCAGVSIPDNRSGPQKKQVFAGSPLGLMGRQCCRDLYPAEALVSPGVL